MLDFSKDERKTYSMLEKEAKGLLNKFVQGREERSYSYILELLLRMRQFSVSISILHN
jgi:hypothetical protein